MSNHLDAGDHTSQLDTDWQHILGIYSDPSGDLVVVHICHHVIWVHFDDITFTSASWIRQKLCGLID